MRNLFKYVILINKIYIKISDEIYCFIFEHGDGILNTYMYLFSFNLQFNPLMFKPFYQFSSLILLSIIKCNDILPVLGRNNVPVEIITPPPKLLICTIRIQVMQHRFQFTVHREIQNASDATSLHSLRVSVLLRVFPSDRSHIYYILSI